GARREAGDRRAVEGRRADPRAAEGAGRPAETRSETDADRPVLGLRRRGRGGAARALRRRRGGAGGGGGSPGAEAGDGLAAVPNAGETAAFPDNSLARGAATGS